MQPQFIADIHKIALAIICLLWVCSVYILFKTMGHISTSNENIKRMGLKNKKLEIEVEDMKRYIPMEKR